MTTPHQTDGSDRSAGQPEAYMTHNQYGVWGETVAAAWLMKNGYEVFVGLGNTSCDLIALRDGMTYRVEVKAGSRLKRASGPTQKLCIAGVIPERFDMLLVITPDGDVLQNPTSDQVWGVAK